MRLVGHVLDHILNHMLNHIIIGLMIMALHQDNLFINFTIGSTLYLCPKTVMSIESSSNKSRFIYYFRIAYIKKDWPLIEDQ